jgi:uncharacterized protein YigA (DUF484 family)
MNKRPATSVTPDGNTEDLIIEHLLAHPEFFERHPGVLARLKLPHQRGHAAVSLIERQVLVLREKHASLEQKLHELIENGRANDAIAGRMHRLALRLLRARGEDAVLTALEASLREDFGASRWVVLVTDPAFAGLASHANRSVRVVPRGSPELKAFESFFESARPRSGVIRDVQREYLFGNEPPQVGSAVLIPLGEHASLGLLAVASDDTERYQPTMSTDFLARIGEIVSEAIRTRGA